MSDEKTSLESDLNPVVSFHKGNVGNLATITSFTSARGREIAVTGDVDEAMALVIDGEDEVTEFDEETKKKVLRKTDLYLLPLICLLYAFQFMDKTTTSYAAVMGLKKDFNMVGDMYSWCGTSFYMGYLAFEFPANAIQSRPSIVIRNFSRFFFGFITIE